MARRVFFSFYYEGDIGRVGQIRNSWLTKPDRDSAGFWDAVEWEEVKRKTKSEIERWILNKLNGTSVTVVLIGENTYGRDWVDFEIVESYKGNNGILGIYIHNVKDFRTGRTSNKGQNPFSKWYIEKDGRRIYFSEIYPVYDWVSDNGIENLGKWVEEAAKKTGR